MKTISRLAPFILLAAYIGFNEYRLADYAHVRQDAIMAIHAPKK